MTTTGAMSCPKAVRTMQQQNKKMRMDLNFIIEYACSNKHATLNRSNITFTFLKLTDINLRKIDYPKIASSNKNG
jgi:hypothetical protein